MFTVKGSGWQATCPFHRGTETAPLCRKMFGGKASPDALLLMAKAWCVAADQFERKYTHLRHLPNEEQDAAQLELQVALMTAPLDEPMPDQVLDEVYGAVEVGPIMRRTSARSGAASSAASSSMRPASASG